MDPWAFLRFWAFLVNFEGWAALEPSLFPLLAQHLEQVLILDDTPASNSSHGANAAQRQPSPQASLDDLIVWEEVSNGCLDEGRCACALLWEVGTHFVHQTSIATSSKPST